MSLTPEQTTAQNFKNFYDRIRPLLNAQHYHVDRSGQELKVGEYTLSGTLPDSTSQSTQLGISTRDYNSTGVKRNDFNIEDNCVVIPAGMTVEITSNIYTKPGASSESNTDMHFFDYTHNVAIDYLSSAYHNSGYAIAGTWSTIFAATENTKIGIKCTYSTGQRVINGSSRLVVKEIGRIVDPVQYVSSGDNLEETPVGNIISYMGNNVPKHYLACDGTEYVIGTYPELEAHFISEFGSVNYFGGDGASTWAVPDLRGEFLRGTGSNGHTASGDGADVGTHQSATGINPGWVNNQAGGFSLPVAPSSDYSALVVDAGDKYVNTGKRKSIASSTDLKEVANTTSDGGYWTVRPTNTSVQYCIKYENTYHVIVPSHEYKCEASFGLTYNSTIQSYTSYSMVYIAGDTSMMDANHFVAPMDGWYSVSFKSSQLDYTKPSIQYIQINDVTSNAFVDGTGSGTSHSHFGINMTQTLYLNKGDKVNYRVWTNGNTISLPAVRSASFCLLTSNYKENIIAGGEVYSTDEQEIGTWTDGKKLYQKTIAVTSQPTINTWGSGYEIGASVDTIVKVTGRLVLDNNAGTYVGNTTWPITTDDDYINYIGTDNRHPSLPNRVGVKVGKQGYTSRPVTITVQYTKTTDTANQYTYKNSLLLTRPDLWDVGVEYDFGGGLYGKRIMDSSIDVASGNTIQPSIAASGVTAIIGYGGMYGNSSSAMAGFGAPIVIRTNSTIAAESAPQIGGTGGLAARICNIAWTTNINKYDVWVTYRKA